MDESNQGKNLNTTEKNTSAGKRAAKHTWIGDKDEVRPEYAERPVRRTTYTGTEPRDTKLVQRQRKPYTGFITDEEVRSAEAAAEIDRRARAERMAAMDSMKQTKVYSGLGEDPSEAEQKAEEVPAQDEKAAKKRRSRKVNIRVSDSRKFSRLVVLLVVLAVLLVYEISFVVMQAGIATLPGKTAKLKSELATLQADNAEIQKAADEIGDYHDIKDLRDSWKTIKDKLEE